MLSALLDLEEVFDPLLPGEIPASLRQHGGLHRRRRPRVAHDQDDLGGVEDLFAAHLLQPGNNQGPWAEGSGDEVYLGLDKVSRAHFVDARVRGDDLFGDGMAHGIACGEE